MSDEPEPNYIMLMHNDGSRARPEDWGRYIGKLRASGNFAGGSAIGTGLSLRKTGTAGSITDHVSGYILVSADSLDHARQLLVGNPVFEAGGTVEIRNLPTE